MYSDVYSRGSLMSAVYNRNFEEVKKLVELGHSVNANDNQGCTPLHVAIFTEE